jgi:PBSX family phage terminase large subunit
MEFYKSEAQNPALISAWGTGKSMSLILKTLYLCKKYPGNLGAIYRKERVQLEKSTIMDFKRYTNDFQGMEWREQKKELYLPSCKSTIMFLHADTVGTVNNINLGFAGIEQAEEIEDDGSTFDMIGGRCRREKSSRQCFVIANAVDENHWVYRYWISANDKVKFPYWTATMFDNAEFLPADYLERQRGLEIRNPAVYKRYVMNMFGISDDKFVVINPADMEALNLTERTITANKRIISCDPSTGGDECVIDYFTEGGRLTDQLILHENDTMKIASQLFIWGSKKKCHNYAIDTIGIGKGIADRLNELTEDIETKNVIDIQSAGKALDDNYANCRAEMWFYAQNRILDKELSPIEDDTTRKQLSAVRFKMTSKGQYLLEPKEETKKRLGQSPDRADAYIYGIWGMSQISEEKPIDIWDRARRRRQSEEVITDWMSV